MTTPHLSTTRSADDFALKVETTGTGAPLLLLHGGGGPSTLASIREHYADTGLVVMPVHPGWDGTTHPAHLDSVSSLAALYLELLHERGLRGVTVIGSSFGGWIGIEMACQDEHSLIAKLVIVDGVGIRPLPEHRPARAGAAAAPAGGESSEAFALMHRYTGTDLWDDDLPQRMQRISAATLVVWGADDPVVTSAYGRTLAALIKDSHFVEIPHAGHLPADENPVPTFTAVDSFVAATPAVSDAR